MKSLLLRACPMKSLLFTLTLAVASAYAAEPSHGTVESFDPRFAELVAADAVIEKLGDGLKWAEGPVWYQDALVLSDPPTNTAYRWKPGTKGLEVFLMPSGSDAPIENMREAGSNGLAVDAKGRLILCQHGARRVARYENGKFVPLAERYQGKRFNSPNDLAIRKSGEVYFTDPPYGLKDVDKSPLKELPYHGVYRLANDGTVTLLIDDLAFPNGIAFSPDEKVLYVAVSARPSRVFAYPVKEDGTVGKGRIFFDLSTTPKLPGPDGVFDGMKVDVKGNLWCGGPAGVWVISPEGKLLGRIGTGVPTANCGWGDDGSVLYIAANNDLRRVRTKTKGAGW